MELRSGKRASGRGGGGYDGDDDDDDAASLRPRTEHPSLAVLKERFPRFFRDERMLSRYFATMPDTEIGQSGPRPPSPPRARPPPTALTPPPLPPQACCAST